MWSWPEPASGSTVGQDRQSEYTAKNPMVKTGHRGRE